MGVKQHEVDTYPPSIHWEASQDTHPSWVVTETDEEGNVTKTSYDTRKEADDYISSLNPREEEVSEEVEYDEMVEAEHEAEEKPAPRKRAAAKK